jgi:ribosomal protein S12 methylthiotransferase accessory factor
VANEDESRARGNSVTLEVDSVSAASLRRLIDVADYLVDEKVGIVRRVKEVRRDPGSPAFFHFAAEGCNASAFCHQENFRNTGGASTDRSLAMAKAIGEAVERYCAALYAIEQFPFHPADEAPFPHTAPEEFALYSREQYEAPGFPWVPFDGAAPVRWTPMRDPAGGDTIYAPAAFVWIPFRFYQGSGDAPIGQPISTGLACHCSYEEAALAGLGEVVERDAVMIMWQAALSMPQIRVETLDDANYDLVQRCERTGDRVTLLNITLDAGIPTVMAVLQGATAERPALVFAAAASLDPVVAARKALEELVHTRRYSQQLWRYMQPIVPDEEYSAVMEQTTHLLFYSDAANAHLAEFVFASKARQEFDAIPDLSTGDPARDLGVFVERVRAAGHRPLLADLTSEDVRELGLCVVRALIPGYHPLCMGYPLRALGGRRLWEVPQRLGYAGITPETGDHRAPHPYP